MNQQFKALILTYKTASLNLREQVSLNEGSTRQLLKFMQEYTPASEALVVSTCNRTEIYYSAEQDLSDKIIQGIKLIKNPDAGFESYFTALSYTEAIRHLFEVSIGLDAQIVGDLQISGQIKTAYQLSADENMAGPFLHRLLHTIFFVNKRVVQETSFRDGAASISYAAKELAEDLVQGSHAPSALVVGVGEIGQDVCLNLVNSVFKKVTILNRTIEKAAALSEKTGFAFGNIDELPAALAKADVIFSSVSGDQPLITKELLSKHPTLSHKFLIDLSIPRSVEPTVEEIPGIELYNLDDIQEKTNEALEKRKASIPTVQAIIQEAITDFEDWSKEMIVSPTIQKLKNALEQIRKEEVARYLKNADEKEAATIEELSRNLVQKFMKLPVLQLKAACKRGNAESLVEVLNELFDLEKKKTH